MSRLVSTRGGQYGVSSTTTPPPTRLAGVPQAGADNQIGRSSARAGTVHCSSGVGRVAAGCGWWRSSARRPCAADPSASGPAGDLCPPSSAPPGITARTPPTRRIQGVSSVPDTSYHPAAAGTANGSRHGDRLRPGRSVIEIDRSSTPFSHSWDSGCPQRIPPNSVRPGVVAARLDASESPAGKNGTPATIAKSGDRPSSPEKVDNNV